MEDLLEDEDEDFDKDDKVITSRQASTKKKKCLHARACAQASGGGWHTRKTHTQTHWWTKWLFSLSLLSPPLCLAALFAVISRRLATFLFSPVSKKALFPPFQASVSLFFLSCNPFLICAYFFLPAVEFMTRTLWSLHPLPARTRGCIKCLVSYLAPFTAPLCPSKTASGLVQTLSGNNRWLLYCLRSFTLQEQLLKQTPPDWRT